MRRTLQRSPCLGVSAGYVPPRGLRASLYLWINQRGRVRKPLKPDSSGPLGNEIRRNLIYTRDFVAATPAHSPVAGCVKEFLIELAHLASELVIFARRREK